MKPMTHRERFLHNRWLERRARKIKAARLAKQAKKIDPQAKPTVGWWPGMYEGVPNPNFSSRKAPHYQEQAYQSVGYQKAVTAIAPRKQPDRKSDRHYQILAPPIGAKEHTQSQRDLTGGEAVITPHPEPVRSEVASITCDREIQKLSANLSGSHKEPGKTEFRVLGTN